MTEVARLALEADTNGIVKAKSDLEKLVPAARKAAGAIDEMSGKFDKTNGSAIKAVSGMGSLDDKMRIAAVGMGVSSTAALKAGSSFNAIASAARGAIVGVNGLTAVIVSPAINKARVDAKAYSQSLKDISPSADKAAASIRRMQGAANDNISRLQATPGNLAAQFQDIGVTAAGGMSPMLIALQQGTQLSAAFAGGGLSSIGAAIGQILSPIALLTIGIVGLIAAGIQMIDWANVAKSAITALADLITEYGTIIAGVSGLMLLAFAPQIIGAIIATSAAIYTAFTYTGLLYGALGKATVAMYLFALANPFTAIVLGIGLVIGAAILMGDKFKQIFGFDIIEVIKPTVNFMIAVFLTAFDNIIASFNFLSDRWAEVVGYLGKFWDEFCRLTSDRWTEAYNSIVGLFSYLPEGVGKYVRAAAEFVTRTVREMIADNVSWLQKLMPFLPASMQLALLAMGALSAGSGKRFGEDYLGGAIAGVKKASAYVGGALSDFAQNSFNGKPKKTKDSKDASTTEGPKTEGDKFADLVSGVKLDIGAINAEILGLNMTADAALRLKNETELLNKAKSQNISTMGLQGKALIALAGQLTNAQIALRDAKGFKEITDGADKSILSLQQESELIGKIGYDLIFATEQQRLYNEAKSKGIDLSDPRNSEKRSLIDEKAGTIAAQTMQNAKDRFFENVELKNEKFNDDLVQQRKELFLTGQALLSARAAYDLINEAKQTNADLSDEEIAALQKLAKEQVAAKQALENYASAIEFGKSTFRSFFQDIRDGLLQGKSVWKSFGDAAMGVLDRLIERLSDKLITTLIDQLFSALGGGAEGGGIGGVIAGLFSAKGNSFDGNGVTGFANGGSFTNGVVNKTTAFAFGKGGANLGIMGEAGPEAIMPLQRGSDGSLGVQMYGNAGQGSGGNVNNVTVQNNYTLSGAVSSADIVELNKRSAEQTKTEVKRNLTVYLQQYQRDGAIV